MFKQIKELREKQASILANARSLFESISKETTEERAADLERQHDAAMADYDKVGKDIERLERMARAEAALEERDSRRPRGENTDERRSERGGDDEAPTYDEVFKRYLLRGHQDLTREERSVLQRGARQLNEADLPPELRAQSSVTGAAGAFTVPQGFSGELDINMKMYGPMWDADIVREMKTDSGNDIPWPTVDDTSQTGALLAENTAATDDGSGDVAFGQKTLKAHVYTTKIIRIPLQLLADSAFNMEQLIGQLFGERLGRVANTALTTGTGAAQPEGIVAGAGAGNTTAGVAAVTFDEIMDLLHSVDPAFRDNPKSRFMMNDNTLKVIRKLKDGQGNYLWQEGNVKDGQPARILNKPYSINQAMADMATGAKFMLFGDLSRYVVRKVTDTQIITMRERYAEFLQVGMVGFRRFDGRVINSSAIKYMKNA